MHCPQPIWQHLGMFQRCGKAPHKGQGPQAGSLGTPRYLAGWPGWGEGEQRRTLSAVGPCGGEVRCRPVASQWVSPGGWFPGVLGAQGRQGGRCDVTGL